MIMFKNNGRTIGKNPFMVKSQRHHNAVVIMYRNE